MDCPHNDEDCLIPQVEASCLNCGFNGGDLFCFVMIGFSALFVLAQMIRAHAFIGELARLSLQ